MPNTFLKKVADVCELSPEKAEELWDQAKQIAKKRGYTEQHPAFYAYVTGIFKNSLGQDCETTLEQPAEETSEELGALTLSMTRAGQVLAMLAEADAPTTKKTPDELNPLLKAGEKEARDNPPAKKEPAPKTPDTVAKSDDAEVKKYSAEELLARDLSELYQDLILRWENTQADQQKADDKEAGRVSDDKETTPQVMQWSDGNPYAELPDAVRETLQAGAVLHYAQLDGLRAAAERAMRDWQITQPQLLDDMANALRDLPTLHRQALSPIVQELVDQGLLPQTAMTSLDPAMNPDPERWLNAFPSLLASNALHTATQSTLSKNMVGQKEAEKVVGAVADTVTETLVECLLYNAGGQRTCTIAH